MHDVSPTSGDKNVVGTWPFEFAVCIANSHWWWIFTSSTDLPILVHNAASGNCFQTMNLNEV